ncbi:hypothetical protein Tco_0849750 [Tanacetum coccineum]
METSTRIQSATGWKLFDSLVECTYVRSSYQTTQALVSTRQQKVNKVILESSLPDSDDDFKRNLIEFRR